MWKEEEEELNQPKCTFLSLSMAITDPLHSFDRLS